MLPSVAHELVPVKQVRYTAPGPSVPDCLNLTFDQRNAAVGGLCSKLADPFPQKCAILCSEAVSGAGTQNPASGDH